MISFVKYSPDTGEILSRGIASTESEALLSEKQGVAVLFNKEQKPVSDITHYVDIRSNEIKNKIENPTVSDGKKLTNMPQGCFLTAIGPSIVNTETEDSQFLLQDVPSGRYTVKVKPKDPKYLQAKFYLKV